MKGFMNKGGEMDMTVTVNGKETIKHIMKRRWFTLEPGSKKLAYFSDHLKTHKGDIDLSEVSEISVDADYKINLVTPGRTWVLDAYSEVLSHHRHGVHGDATTAIAEHKKWLALLEAEVGPSSTAATAVGGAAAGGAAAGGASAGATGDAVEGFRLMGYAGDYAEAINAMGNYRFNAEHSAKTGGRVYTLEKGLPARHIFRNATNGFWFFSDDEDMQAGKASGYLLTNLHSPASVLETTGLWSNNKKESHPEITVEKIAFTAEPEEGGILVEGHVGQFAHVMGVYQLRTPSGLGGPVYDKLGDLANQYVTVTSCAPHRTVRLVHCWSTAGHCLHACIVDLVGPLFWCPLATGGSARRTQLRLLCLLGGRCVMLLTLFFSLPLYHVSSGTTSLSPPPRSRSTSVAPMSWQRGTGGRSRTCTARADRRTTRRGCR